MQDFTDLFIALDRIAKLLRSVSSYLSILSVPRKQMPLGTVFFNRSAIEGHGQTADLKRWACQVSGLPEWLFAECYDHGRFGRNARSGSLFSRSSG